MWQLIADGDHEMLRRLLQTGVGEAQCNDIDEDTGYSALHTAAAEGQVECVELLLQQRHIDVNQKVEAEIVEEQAEEQNEEQAEEEVESEDVKYRKAYTTELGRTVFHTVVSSNKYGGERREKLLQLLLDYGGAKIDRKCMESVLRHAMFYAEPTIVGMLLDYNETLPSDERWFSDEDGWPLSNVSFSTTAYPCKAESILMLPYIAVYNRRLGILKLLLDRYEFLLDRCEQRGVEFDFSHVRECAYLAVENSDLDTVEFLFDKFAASFHSHDNGNGLLCKAIAYCTYSNKQSMRIVEYLLREGCKPYSVTNYGGQGQVQVHLHAVAPAIRSMFDEDNARLGLLLNLIPEEMIQEYNRGYSQSTVLGAYDERDHLIAIASEMIFDNQGSRSVVMTTRLEMLLKCGIGLDAFYYFHAYDSRAVNVAFGRYPRKLMFSTKLVPQYKDVYASQCKMSLLAHIVTFFAKPPGSFNSSGPLNEFSECLNGANVNYDKIVRLLLEGVKGVKGASLNATHPIEMTPLVVLLWRSRSLFNPGSALLRVYEMFIDKGADPSYQRDGTPFTSSDAVIVAACMGNAVVLSRLIAQFGFSADDVLSDLSRVIFDGYFDSSSGVPRFVLRQIIGHSVDTLLTFTAVNSRVRTLCDAVDTKYPHVNVVLTGDNEGDEVEAWNAMKAAGSYFLEWNRVDEKLSLISRLKHLCRVAVHSQLRMSADKRRHSVKLASLPIPDQLKAYLSYEDELKTIVNV